MSDYNLYRAFGVICFLVLIAGFTAYGLYLDSGTSKSAENPDKDSKDVH